MRGFPRKTTNYLAKMIRKQVLFMLLFAQATLPSTNALANNGIETNFKNSSSENSSSRQNLIINGIAGKITNHDWRKQVNQVEWPLNIWLSEAPTNAVRCKLFCKTGYHLQIRRNGAVSGTLNQKSKYTTFELQSFGTSIIRMKNVATNYYLSMKKNGLFTGVKQADTLQSLFREKHEFNAFNSYASVKYYRKKPYDMYIGIKNNGKIKRAMKTHRAQTATQFLVVKI